MEQKYVQSHEEIHSIACDKSSRLESLGTRLDENQLPKTSLNFLLPTTIGGFRGG